MYQGKHSRDSVLAQRRQARMRRQTAALASIALLGVFAVGGVIAFLITGTQPVQNTFMPSEVTCKVEETMENNVKSDVKVVNTGDVPAYIRVAVVANWMNPETKDVLGITPKAGEDYEISFASEGWMKGEDGFWYCKEVVPVGQATKVLINSCEPKKKAPAEGYVLSIGVVSSAVQADGTTIVGEKEIPAVVDAWDNDSIILSVNEDGTLSVVDQVRE